MAPLADGSLLMAWEQDVVEPDGSHDGHVRFVLRPGPAWTVGGADRVFDAPRTLSPFAGGFEGTPWIHGVDADGTIRAGLHFLATSFLDRAASGVLSGFAGAAPATVPVWSAARDDGINTPMLAAGAAANIGDGEDVTVAGVPVTLMEGQRVRNDFSTWSPYVVDRAGDGIAERVAVATPAASKSFGNPTLGVVPAPGGGTGQVAVVTLFVFGDGAGPGEAGELLFYRPV